MIIQTLTHTPIINKIIYKISRNRAKTIVGRISEYLPEKSRILDIGAGACGVAELLIDKGHGVVPLDIHDVSFVNNVKPIIYDGTRIPFDDNSFDFVIVILVLHHTKDPKAILKEAKRVSKNIILMEEIYSTKIQKYLTHFWDDLINLEFFVNPHNNKTVSEWEDLFNQLNLKLEATKYHKGDMFPLMHQVAFFLTQF
ncbi:class I SAM-dependent methyltransferase [candidate division WWE3 bacterium]|uniref:Class I SAM-dependent methyltransferase n=1 Tax=candidate division WWE3 bacterium TaxID=2053526 RepID=A0A3A4ZMG2_UNCKA|nr:MAG: class I SAM-dependent methyltransferase [candidate division WWE3 bacterium]